MKPSERLQKPVEVQLRMVKSSSDMEGAQIKTDSGSSQEPLINEGRKGQDLPKTSEKLTTSLTVDTQIFANCNDSMTKKQ